MLLGLHLRWRCCCCSVVQAGGDFGQVDAVVAGQVVGQVGTENTVMMLSFCRASQCCCCRASQRSCWASQ